jgi:ribonuclease HI
MSLSSVTVATDGACKKNPGPAGWAWVTEDGRWASGSLRAGTNNIGELLAVLNALQAHAATADLSLLIDSQYVIDSYSKWMDGWARRGWSTAAGAPVANQDIMRALIAARDGRRALGLPDAKLVKVKGHSGHTLNAWADIKAVEASERGAAGVESTRGTGHGDHAVDTTEMPAGATVRTPAPKRYRRRR